MHLILILVLLLTVILGLSWVFREIKCIHYTFLCSLNGPKGLPVLGSLLTLLRSYKAPMKPYSKWAVEFGGFYKVKIGPQLAVVVSDSEYFTKVFAKTGNKLNYRVRGNVLSLAMGNKGIATSDGKVWMDHRRFATKAFRELNIGKSASEEVISSEVNKLVNTIKKGCNGSKMNNLCSKAESDLTLTVFSILWHFVSGNPSKAMEDRVGLSKMLEGTQTQLKAAEQSGGWNYFLILQILWIISANPLILLPSYIRRVLFVKQELRRHRQELADTVRDDHKPNIVKLYLEEILNQNKEPSELNEKHLEVFMSDFIVAGVESLSSSIRWTLMYLVAYPDCMDILRKELDGRRKNSTIDEIMSYSMRHELPYLEAVIAESLRIRPAIHTIVHVTQEDIIIADEFVPKETWIIGNIWGVHHDPKVWENPESFRPERFIDKDGQIMKELLDKCISFSTGPRRCLGEQLSRMELHAFIAALVSEFDISINPDKVDSFTLEPDVSLAIIPKDQYLVFKLRDNKLA